MEGSKFMFKFPMAILDIFKKDLLKMDLEEINNFLEGLNSSDSNNYDIEFIIERARKIQISKIEVL